MPSWELVRRLELIAGDTSRHDSLFDEAFERIENLEGKLEDMGKREDDLSASVDRAEALTTSVGNAIVTDIEKLKQLLAEEGVENEAIDAVTTRVTALGDALTQDLSTLTSIPAAPDVTVPPVVPVTDGSPADTAPADATAPGA